MAETAETNIDEFRGKDCISWWIGWKPKAYTSCVLYLKVSKNDLCLSYINMCCLISMGYWPSASSRLLDIGQVYLLRVYKFTKKEWGQYPAILIEQTWSIKDLLYGFRGNFSCRIQQVVLSRQDTCSSILLDWVANHSTGFGSSCPLTDLGPYNMHYLMLVPSPPPTLKPSPRLWCRHKHKKIMH